jgi:hypothetical protein
MRTRTAILVSTVLLVFGASSATAGPCTTEIDAFAKTLAAQDAGSGPTAGGSATQPARRSGEHPPSAIMGQQTEGKAASPEDVRRQTEGQPPAAQQGTTGAVAGTGSASAASQKLDQARALNQQGKEAECMDAVRQAKQLVGPR